MYSRSAIPSRSLSKTNTPTDPLHHQKLICWLEDAHIRLLSPAARPPLRTASFRQFLLTYLRRLSHPPATDDLLPAVARLASLALQLHYGDARAAYGAPHDPWHGRRVPVIADAADDPAVQKAADTLCRAVGATPAAPAHDAARVTAAAVAAVLAQDGPPGAHSRALGDVPLGVDAASGVVESYARVVRVLHTRQLRALQDAVNGAIAQMQEVTADPKTDARLGRVGR